MNKEFLRPSRARLSQGAYVLSLAALALSFGCNKKMAAPSQDVVISGVASASLVAGGKVTLALLDKDGNTGQIVATAMTNDAGEYKLTGKTAVGAAIVKVAGGTYTDEATGNKITLTEMASVVDLEVITKVNGAGAGADKSLSEKTLLGAVNLTPLSHWAAQVILADAKTNGLKTDAIAKANVATAQLMGLGDIDITQVKPANPSKSLSDQGLTADSKEAKYALALAAISQMAANAGGSTSSMDQVKSMQANYELDGTKKSGTSDSAPALSTAVASAATQVVTHSSVLSPSYTTVPVPTHTGTVIPAPVVTATAAPASTPTHTAAPAPTVTASPTATATPSPTPTVTATPTASPSPALSASQVRASVATYLSSCNSQSRQLFKIVHDADAAILHSHQAVSSAGVSGKLTALKNVSTASCNSLLSDMQSKVKRFNSLSFASSADGQGCGSVYNASRMVHALNSLLDGVAPTGTSSYSSLGKGCN